MKYILYSTIALLFHICAIAQQFYIRGEVQDETGHPLQNVSILQQNTGYTYFSGTSGAFGITTSKKTDTLTFSLSGYQTQKLAVNATDFITVKLIRNLTSDLHSFKLSSLTQNLEREIQQQWFIGDETYASIIENHFINADKYPTTGIKLNVDRASYSNIRRFLNMNSAVPQDAVRIEEMLNYFNLAYKEPANNKTFEIHTLLTDCPWNEDNQLLFAHITSKKLYTEKLPPSHLVFLIDVSGSMDMPNRLPVLKAGFHALINNLRGKDTVSIVAYGGTVRVVLNAVSGADKDSIFKVIDKMQAGGSTPGESGINLAYRVAKAHFIKNGNNRVILATDGDFNVGLKTDEELEQLILKQKQSGIYLTCLGVGMGNYKDSKIQTLAQKGNGNFAYIDSYAEAEKVLLQEFTQTLYTVADDVFLNMHFNPAFVKEYRVIGFDNKVGAIKDTSATIEGGDIGPAYSLLAAFEIVPTDNNIEQIQKDGLLQPVTFTLMYKEPGSIKAHQMTEAPQVQYTSLENADKAYQFASAVIMFGSLLRNSRFVKRTSWNDVLQLAEKCADTNNFSQKEFITLVQLAKNMYGKKRKVLARILN